MRGIVIIFPSAFTTSAISIALAFVAAPALSAQRLTPSPSNHYKYA